MDALALAIRLTYYYQYQVKRAGYCPRDWFVREAMNRCMFAMASRGLPI